VGQQLRPLAVQGKPERSQFGRQTVTGNVNRAGQTFTPLRGTMLPR
jgi:hypothetical protein